MMVKHMLGFVLRVVMHFFNLRFDSPARHRLPSPQVAEARITPLHMVQHTAGCTYTGVYTGTPVPTTSHYY